MHGAEYDELKEAVDSYKDKFESVTTAEPLLCELQTFAPWSAIVGEVSELRATALEFD